MNEWVAYFYKQLFVTLDFFTIIILFPNYNIDDNFVVVDAVDGDDVESVANEVIGYLAFHRLEASSSIART